MTIILLLWALPILAAESTNTTVAVDQQVVCVYPISGQYGHISRWLTYATLLFAILMQGEWATWIIVGGLAATMVSTCGCAIHALVIWACNGPKPEVLDLDVLAINSILVLNIHSVYFLLRWSPVMQKFKERYRLVLVWGMYIFVCFLINFVTMIEIKVQTTGDATFGDKICLSSNNTALESASQLTQRGLTFNCNYSCFNSTKSRIRDASEIRVVPQDHILLHRYLGILVLSGLAIISSLLLLGEALLGEEADAQAETDSIPSLRERSRGRKTSRLSPSLRKLAWMRPAVGVVIALAALALFESQLLSPHMPTSWLGHNYLSGQWAPALTVAFGLVAPIVDRLLSEW